MAMTIKNMTGKRFGLLTVVCREGSHQVSGGATWLCHCDCGSEKVIEGRLLRNGTTNSCGCLQKKNGTTHGHSNDPTYYSWRAMLKRCNNEKHVAYKNYGGRGITVCHRWQDSFVSFLTDMGERPSLQFSIDRIDSDGNYEPGNCRWATSDSQSRNRRNNVRLTLNGVTMTAAEWARKVGICQTSLQKRLKKGWPVEEALTRPYQKGIAFSVSS